MQILQNQDGFGGIEAGHVLAESVRLTQVAKDLSAGHVVEEDIKEVLVREGPDEVGDEGVSSYLGQDLALVAHMVNLSKPDYCSVVNINFCQEGPQRPYLWSCALS